MTDPGLTAAGESSTWVRVMYSMITAVPY